MYVFRLPAKSHPTGKTFTIALAQDEGERFNSGRIVLFFPKLDGRHAGVEPIWIAEKDKDIYWCDSEISIDRLADRLIGALCTLHAFERNSRDLNIAWELIDLFLQHRKLIRDHSAPERIEEMKILINSIKDLAPKRMKIGTRIQDVSRLLFPPHGRA